MPAWLLSMLLNLVLKIGIPLLLDWLKKVFPNLPIPANLAPILTEYVAEVRANKSSIKQAKANAKKKIMECYGTACPMDTKQD